MSHFPFRHTHSPPTPRRPACPCPVIPTHRVSQLSKTFPERTIKEHVTAAGATSLCQGPGQWRPQAKGAAAFPVSGKELSPEYTNRCLSSKTSTLGLGARLENSLT